MADWVARANVSDSKPSENVGCASCGRFLQWMPAKLSITVKVLEDRQLRCFSKRDGGDRKRRLRKLLLWKA
jgi:hypothetical protein